MLKHALSTSGVGNGGVPRYSHGEQSRCYRSPHQQMNHSYTHSTSQRSFNQTNPYSNVSTLSNSKHSVGGTSASVSPLGGPRGPGPCLQGGYHEGSSTTKAYPPPAGLHVSTLSTSKHSLGGNSSSVSPLGAGPPPHVPRLANGGLCLAPLPPPRPPQDTDNVSKILERTKEPGVREMLTSLGLLCLVSLLLALLSLIFMLKISPVTASDVKDLIRSDQVTVISPEEYVLVYEVTLALCALSLSLNLCCLLVCAVQFLFAVKLVRDSPDGERTNKYLKKSAFTRVCAVGGFFVSIPVFLTGIILYTFIQFHSTPAVVTSILIGLGIMFCGCAMVHNVFVWQKEKTNAVRALAQQHRLALQREHSLAEQSRSVMGLPSLLPNSGSISPGPLPNATLDLSNETPTPPEICTLV